MDTRRLRCLVLERGLVVEAVVHDRHAMVLALEHALRRDAGAFDKLELFVARTLDDDQYLAVESRDAQCLAFGDKKQDTATRQRFLTPRHVLANDRLVHDYFPRQPPLSDGPNALVHVLARVQSASLVVMNHLPRNTDGATARLVASAKRTRSDLLLRPKALRNGITTEVPLVLRCRLTHGLLWLGHDDDVAKTTLLLPPSWRRLAADIFRWLFVDTKSKGRRAVLTGAPRGGKSAFLGFMLVQLLWLHPPRPVCIVDVPGVTFARISERHEVLEGTRSVDFRDDVNDPGTVYLFDAPATGPAAAPLRARDVAARTLVVTASIAAPKAMTRTQSFVLPLWPLHDVLVCRHLHKLPLDGVSTLFHKWGGVPGRLCIGDVAASDARLETMLRRLTNRTILQALATLQRTEQWHDVATGTDSDRWRALVIPTGAIDGDVAFTSQYVCDRVIATLPLPTWTIRRRAPPTPTTLWTQIRTSLAYLAQEEEEKHETPPPANAAGVRQRVAW